MRKINSFRDILKYSKLKKIRRCLLILNYNSESDLFKAFNQDFNSFKPYLDKFIDQEVLYGKQIEFIYAYNNLSRRQILIFLKYIKPRFCPNLFLVKEMLDCNPIISNCERSNTKSVLRHLESNFEAYLRNSKF